MITLKKANGLSVGSFIPLDTRSKETASRQAVRFLLDRLGESDTSMSLISNEATPAAAVLPGAWTAAA